MAPPISLTIMRQGDTNIIDLAEMGTLIPRSETQVDDDLLQELVAEVTRLATPRYEHRESVAIVRELRRIGEVIFSHLLPEPARKRLRLATPCDLYLRLDERLIQVPWELCHDGEQFLATKFRMGRQVITSTPLPHLTTTDRGRRPLRVLLIADPTETLPQANQEAEQLCELLGGMKEVKVTLLGGSTVRKVPLLAALQDHEVVHFAGHSQYNAQRPSHSGWELHDGILTAGELGKLSRPPLLVFSNSCQGGATAAWQREAQYERHAFGLGSAFLLAGVQNYISTFWKVQDEESTLFATAFYQNLTIGHSLGEALVQARQAIIAQRGWAGLTWASYMLYGDPAFTLLPTIPDQALPGVPAATQTQSSGAMWRKLAAILCADVKGYSRLMGEDEVATIRTLTAYRGAMTTLIQQHHGRVVDSPGDNLLAEFASVVDAVQCAVEIQEALKVKNAELLPNRRMEFRIGINVGDVVSEGERLYGDGVNIAARLEALAEGGGICISGTVYDQVETKLALRYEGLGEQTVKNIAKPVRVYRVLTSLPAIPPLVGSQYSVVSREEVNQKANVFPTQSLAPKPQHSTLVGREAELSQLHRCLEKALNGERQIVFITGEPGIGKTTVVEAFLQSLESRSQRLVSKDQTLQPHAVQTLDTRRQTLDVSLCSCSRPSGWRDFERTSRDQRGGRSRRSSWSRSYENRRSQGKLSRVVSCGGPQAS